MADKVECHKDLDAGVADIVGVAVVVVEAVQNNLYLVDKLRILRKQY